MKFTESYRSQLFDAVASVDLLAVERAIEWFHDARENDRHIFVCGNGGSASTASHFTCDILKGASFQREKRFRMLSLNDSLPTLTAYANDVDYSCVFQEQLQNFAKPGDLLMAISGSGNSPNVVRAVTYANQAGCKTIALTGRDGGKLAPLAQLNIHVKSNHMGRIEDAHMIVCHMIGYHFMEN
ncbi:MAG: SIS domain-containing protein [Bryobacteraceae bacterium]